MTKYLYIIFVFLFLFNCKSSRIASAGEANLKLSTKQLIKENEKQAPNFKTLQSKLKITFTEKGNTQTHAVSFRAKKDEMLWMSATFSIIKALVTPEKISFYNKLDNTYFEGDFSYLSDLLGTELDFKKVQNLLFGEALYDLKDEPYKASVLDSSYVLQPKNQSALFEIFFILDPTLFKVKSQQISQPKEQRHLQIDYKTYQEIDKQILPEKIRVIAVEANEEVAIDLEFKNVSLNEDLRFPYKIPSGFDKIEL
jgi:hypothetical protein